MFDQVEASFACGSVVLFFLFHKKIHVVNFFVKKNGLFRSAGGEIPFWVSNRVTHGDNRYIAYNQCVILLILITCVNIAVASCSFFVAPSTRASGQGAMLSGKG